MSNNALTGSLPALWSSMTQVGVLIGNTHAGSTSCWQYIMLAIHHAGNTLCWQYIMLAAHHAGNTSCWQGLHTLCHNIYYATTFTSNTAPVTSVALSMSAAVQGAIAGQLYEPLPACPCM